MGIVRRIVWLAIFVMALVGGWEFAGNNGTPVRVDYVVGEFGAVPLWLALVTRASGGVAIAILALSARLTRASLAQRRYRKTVAALEAEVHQLRNLPVTAERSPVTLTDATPGNDPPEPASAAEAVR